MILLSSSAVPPLSRAWATRQLPFRYPTAPLILGTCRVPEASLGTPHALLSGWTAVRQNVMERQGMCYCWSIPLPKKLSTPLVHNSTKCSKNALINEVIHHWEQVIHTYQQSYQHATNGASFSLKEKLSLADNADSAEINLWNRRNQREKKLLLSAKTKQVQ